MTPVLSNVLATDLPPQINGSSVKQHRPLAQTHSIFAYICDSDAEIPGLKDMVCQTHVNPKPSPLLRPEPKSNTPTSYNHKTLPMTWSQDHHLSSLHWPWKSRAADESLALLTLDISCQPVMKKPLLGQTAYAESSSLMGEEALPPGWG